MIDVALPALVLIAIGLMWHSALAARETARWHARELCRQFGVQLLDETVALTRIRPRRGNDSRWLLLRTYHFDVSPDGHSRMQAELCLRGRQLVSYRVPEPNRLDDAT
ncbi:MAG TPA: DUF3301 domain-containing protein [Rhodanobacteraceae bacterium]|nr:DUF3301 domain-containing protein [Rhodanobacteraceae bacterium]